MAEINLNRTNARHLPRKVLVLSTTLALSSVVTATAASAHTTTDETCGPRTQSPVFAPWGDNADYFLINNGGFEDGSEGWTFTGAARVVKGNESFFVHSTKDKRSLSLGVGAGAQSRRLCLNRSEDGLRLFVRNDGGPGSILHIEATVRNRETGQIAQSALDVNGDETPLGWSPTMRLGIPNVAGGSATQELTLRFTTSGPAARWSIDDVYIDPFKSF